MKAAQRPRKTTTNEPRQLHPARAQRRSQTPHLHDNDLRVMPLLESKELVGGFAVMELSDVAEALELCRSYAAILGGSVEIDVRPLAAP
jgi:hypothetical protein